MRDEKYNASFRNGEEMWNHFGQSFRYNPHETMHIAMNDKLSEKIEWGALKEDTPNEYYQSIIYRSRSLLMRIRLEDLFVNEVGQYLWDYIHTEFEEIQKDGHDIPDLEDLWLGPEDKHYLKVIPYYINLLNPLTMNWMDPTTPKDLNPRQTFMFKGNPAIQRDENGKYRFEHNTEINVLNCEFLYNNFHNEKPKFTNTFLEDVYCEIERYIYEESVPDEVHDIIYNLSEVPC